MYVLQQFFLFVYRVWHRRTSLCCVARWGDRSTNKDWETPGEKGAGIYYKLLKFWRTHTTFKVRLVDLRLVNLNACHSLFFLLFQAWVANFERPRMNANSLLASPTGLSPYLRFGCLSCRLFYFKLTDLYRKVAPQFLQLKKQTG